MKQADIERWYTRKKIPFFARIRKQKPQTSEEPIAALPEPSEVSEQQEKPTLAEQKAVTAPPESARSVSQEPKPQEEPVESKVEQKPEKPLPQEPAPEKPKKEEKSPNPLLEEPAPKKIKKDRKEKKSARPLSEEPLVQEPAKVKRPKKDGKFEEPTSEELEKAEQPKRPAPEEPQHEEASEKRKKQKKPDDQRPVEPAEPEKLAAEPTEEPAEEEPTPESEEEPMGAASDQSVNRSAALISGLVVVSRLTGFLRTWAQAHALGVTITASCYAVANNLPNQLYELVIGGMLVTAFLPVYLSEKAKGGREAGNKYASNLSTIVLVLMGAITLICIAFAAPIVFTQSFSAKQDFNANLAVYFFRFFAIEVLLYSLSSVFSGVLNAEREYVWSSAAPILNNVVVSASFIAYAFLAESNPSLALLLLALGNPAGVLIQVVAQLPAMRARGIRLRPHINLRDPAIRDTLSIGIPSLVVMLSSFVTVSVMTSSSLSVTPVGASVSYYARLWYTLPYSVLAVPVTTTMFTELSHVYSAGDERGFCRGVVSGTSRILFLLIPFMLFLVVFAVPLVTLLAAGSFGSDGIDITSSYLQALSLSLPAYGVCMYFQKVFSSLREMRAFAAANVIAGVLQVAMCLLLAQIGGLNVVALSSLVFFLAVDLFSLLYLKVKLGRLPIRPIIGATVRSLLFGALGALAGLAIMWMLGRVIGPLGDSAARAVLWCAAGGVPAVIVCFGLQILLRTPESSFFRSMVKR